MSQSTLLPQGPEREAALGRLGATGWYRYKGHSMSDPAKYRTKEEVEDYKQRDPVEVVRRTIVERKLATDKEMEAIENRVNQQVEESVKFAEESAFPGAQEALTDIYQEPDYPFIQD